MSTTKKTILCVESLERRDLLTGVISIVGLHAQLQADKELYISAAAP